MTRVLRAWGAVLIGFSIESYSVHAYAFPPGEHDFIVNEVLSDVCLELQEKARGEAGTCLEMNERCYADNACTSVTRTQACLDCGVNLNNCENAVSRASLVQQEICAWQESSTGHSLQATSAEAAVLYTGNPEPEGSEALECVPTVGPLPAHAKAPASPSFRDVAFSLALRHADFCPGMSNAYEAVHRESVERAERASIAPKRPEQVDKVRDAIRLEIYAAHFYTDLFSPGHLIGLAVAPPFEADPRSDPGVRRFWDEKGLEVTEQGCEPASKDCRDAAACAGRRIACEKMRSAALQCPGSRTWKAFGLKLSDGNEASRCRLRMGLAVSLRHVIDAFIAKPDNDSKAETKSKNSVDLRYPLVIAPGCPSSNTARRLADLPNLAPLWEVGIGGDVQFAYTGDFVQTLVGDVLIPIPSLQKLRISPHAGLSLGDSDGSLKSDFFFGPRLQYVTSFARSGLVVELSPALWGNSNSGSFGFVGATASFAYRFFFGKPSTLVPALSMGLSAGYREFPNSYERLFGFGIFFREAVVF